MGVRYIFRKTLEGALACALLAADLVGLRDLGVDKGRIQIHNVR